MQTHLRFSEFLIRPGAGARNSTPRRAAGSPVYLTNRVDVLVVTDPVVNRCCSFIVVRERSNAPLDGRARISLRISCTPRYVRCVFCILLSTLNAQHVFFINGHQTKKRLVVYMRNKKCIITYDKNTACVSSCMLGCSACMVWLMVVGYTNYVRTYVRVSKQTNTIMEPS